MLTGKITQLSMFNGTGSSNDHAGCRVVVLDVVHQIGTSQRPDVLLRSQDGPSQSSSLEGSSMKVIQNQFFLLFVDFGHFSQDDVAFTLNGAFLQFAVEQNIGKDLDSAANIVLENLGKIDCLFTRSVGVPRMGKLARKSV